MGGGQHPKDPQGRGIRGRRTPGQVPHRPTFQTEPDSSPAQDHCHTAGALQCRQYTYEEDAGGRGQTGYCPAEVDESGW